MLNNPDDMMRQIFGAVEAREEPKITQMVHRLMDVAANLHHPDQRRAVDYLHVLLLAEKYPWLQQIVRDRIHLTRVGMRLRSASEVNSELDTLEQEHERLTMLDHYITLQTDPRLRQMQEVQKLQQQVDDLQSQVAMLHESLVGLLTSIETSLEE